ncbi:MAG: 50S ribosomal protein L10 [Chloroflexota bacterium]
MAISKARKDELVAQYTELIEKSEAIFLTNYQGMSVKKIDSLRDEVVKAEGAFHVTKNTLLKIALEKAEFDVPEDLLQGQLATGFALSEAPTLAKALVDYAKKEDALDLVGGFFGADYLQADGVEALAKLPSLDQLRGQIAGLISAPARNVASVVASGVRQVVNVVDAYSKKEDAEE